MRFNRQLNGLQRIKRDSNPWYFNCTIVFKTNALNRSTIYPPKMSVCFKIIDFWHIAYLLLGAQVLEAILI
jgi:hypothetical protein